MEDPIVLKETRIRYLLYRLRKALEWEGQAEQKSGVRAGIKDCMPKRQTFNLFPLFNFKCSDIHINVASIDREGLNI